MKKSVLLAVLVIFLIAIFPLILSDSTNNTVVNNGFSCLSSNVGDCSTLSTQQEIFTSLASGQCTTQLQQSASNLGCWPSDSCDITTTAQSILALHNSGLSTNQSLSWLLSQGQTTTSDINWYLEIDAASNATCTVSYAANGAISPYTIDISQNKQLDQGAGNCLTLAQNNYWLQVSPLCYNTNFSINCNQQFTTTNLYQRQNFPTIYVSSSSSNSASSGTTVIDSVNSLCFGSSGCDYGTSLWASLALSTLGKDISPYIPYLTTHPDDAQNQKYLPYSFLYALTYSNDFLQSLLSEQKSVNSQNYWQVSGDQYFDTALALLPLQNQNIQEKVDAVNWITSSQGADGCWNSDNVLDTAFILYSVWGSRAKPGQNLLDCVASGYTCLPGLSCTQSGGKNLGAGYNCPASTNICCSQNLTLPSCTSQGGTVCSSSLVCQTGTPIPSADSTSAQICCLVGCAQPTNTTDFCAQSGGTCRSSCLSNEQINPQISCSINGDYCCIAQQNGSSYGWIIFFSVLILLALLGILFRNKLRTFWLKFKSGFKKGKGGPSLSPRGPPRPPYPPMNFQRRPPQLPIPRTQARQQQKPSDLNDVLKRLKEIGK